jgi:hypothetical protein
VRIGTVVYALGIGPLAHVFVPLLRTSVVVYQAWAVPQCGQPTEVDTGASNTYPQEQLYSA